MNKRTAAALRTFAAAAVALAETLEGADDAAPVPPPLPPASPVKRRRGPRLPRGVVVTEEDRKRAEAVADKMGL